MPNELMTVDEAAALKGVTRAAVYAAVKAGRLPHERVLRRIGLRRADVDAWQPIAHGDRPGAGSKGGRKPGSRHSAETRAKIAEAIRRRWADRRQEGHAS
jgi:excisionase family DNA binding protein